MSWNVSERKQIGGGGGGVTQKNPTPTLENVRLG